MPKDEIKLIIASTIFILAFAALSSFIAKPEEEASEAAQGSWACAADVYECPDGSFVQRVPPYCKFDACPN